MFDQRICHVRQHSIREKHASRTRRNGYHQLHQTEKTNTLIYIHSTLERVHESIHRGHEHKSPIVACPRVTNKQRRNACQQHNPVGHNAILLFSACGYNRLGCTRHASQPETAREKTCLWTARRSHLARLMGNQSPQRLSRTILILVTLASTKSSCLLLVEKNPMFNGASRGWWGTINRIFESRPSVKPCCYSGGYRLIECRDKPISPSLIRFSRIPCRPPFKRIFS